MKVFLFEFVQGTGITGVNQATGKTVNVLHPQESYEVDDKLGYWLIEHGKAKGIDILPKADQEVKVKFTEQHEAYRVVIPAEPVPNVANAEPQEENPVHTSPQFEKPQRRARGAK